MNILYLYAELMGYQMPVLKEYVIRHGAFVHVFHWDHKKLTPYKPEVIEGVSYYQRSKFDYISLLECCEKIKPDIIYVSGWMDKEYLKVARHFKIKGIPVVVGCDNQWKNTFRQILGSIYFRLFMRKFFSFIWVPGPYQYEYARRIGFKKKQILFHCYTADVELFHRAIPPDSSYPHKFLFLGRFEEIKGVEMLAKAWNQIEDRKDWELTFIGNGSLNKKLEKYPNIELKEFISPSKLIDEIVKYGCLILPSIDEPYALVIHEAMAAGLPVIASDVCGAAPIFLINGYNGYTFEARNIEALKERLELVINFDNDHLIMLSKNSRARSEIITPKIAAASFMSALLY
jgi:glycosyltransferase involved in cell wall biosynthesis